MKRSPANPLITRLDIPWAEPHLADVSAVFNPGAIRIDGRYILLMRVQTRGRETRLMIAEGRDGGRLKIKPGTVEIEGLDTLDQTIYHVYDPRLTEIDGTVYVVFAADTDDGCRLGIAKTVNFSRIELVSFDQEGDTRNGVLFPEMIGGRYLRLERPNTLRPAGGPATGSEVILAESSDLKRWKPVGPVFSGRPHYWDELVGSGPPPVKTREGWLHIYHGVATHFGSSNIYQAGVVLLDPDDPRRVLARSKNNILEPREPYELAGQVLNVVFPSGMIVERFDGEGFAETDSPVFVYYGAADTVVGLATTTIRELIASCRD